MKVALVYDRVNKWGGAERVLLALNELFPNAPLYTSVYDSANADWAKVFPKVKTSFLQNIPYAKNNHEYLAPLMPVAFENHSFDDYDLVVSVTSEAAKGIITNYNTNHICYCLTPTRYLWSGYEDYFHSKYKKILSKPIVNYLRNWDKKAAHRPDHLLAISTEVKNRIDTYYQRDSEIIFPPVDLEKFSKFKKRDFGDYYLFVSRLVPYKRADLVVKAFNKLNKKLIIIGEGKEKSRLVAMAKPNIEFLSRLTDSELADYYGNSRALIFPQYEDFGLVAVEAQALGTPVIAYRKGGSLDTVVDHKTGLFFDNQNEESIIDAIKRFEKLSFSKSEIQKNARRFSKRNFQKEFIKLIEDVTR